MQTGSGVVLRYEGRKRNATFKTTCGSSPALKDTTTARTPGCSFCRQSASLTDAQSETFQVMSEDDSDRDAIASNHEPVVNSTPPVMVTSTVTAVAASSDVCEMWLIEPRDRVALVPCAWAFSILLQLCGCRCVYTQWMANLQNANSKRSARVHVTIRT